MTLLQAWADSLSLLKLKNLKLFLLVTLKSIIDAYKLLLKYWWWLIAIMIGCFVVPSFTTYPFMAGIYAHKVFDVLYQVLMFAAVVATRPSLEQKNCAYFRTYMPYFLLFM